VQVQDNAFLLQAAKWVVGWLCKVVVQLSQLVIKQENFDLLLNFADVSVDERVVCRLMFC
jgi:hypothetical protein